MAINISFGQVETGVDDINKAAGETAGAYDIAKTEIYPMWGKLKRYFNSLKPGADGTYQMSQEVIDSLAFLREYYNTVLNILDKIKTDYTPAVFNHPDVKREKRDLDQKLRLVKTLLNTWEPRVNYAQKSEPPPGAPTDQNGTPKDDSGSKQNMENGENGEPGKEPLPIIPIAAIGGAIALLLGLKG